MFRQKDVKEEDVSIIDSSIAKDILFSILKLLISWLVGAFLHICFFWCRKYGYLRYSLISLFCFLNEFFPLVIARKLKVIQQIVPSSGKIVPHNTPIKFKQITSDLLFSLFYLITVIKQTQLHIRRTSYERQSDLFHSGFKVVLLCWVYMSVVVTVGQKEKIL